jgi:hypothetical protein
VQLSKKQKGIPGIVGVSFLMCLPLQPAWSQVFPADIDKTLFRPNARSQAMGSIRLLTLSDASAGAFNPALLGKVDAQKGRYSLSIQGSARNEISYWEALEFLDDINEVSDAIRNDPSGFTFDQIRKPFEDLYNFAAKAVGNIREGKALETEISVAPLVGISYQNVGVITYGGIIGVTRLTPGVTLAPDGTESANLDSSAGIIDILTVGIPYAFRIPTGYLGVMPKAIRSDFTGVTFFADEGNRSVAGRSYQPVNDLQADLDVGYISDAFAIPGTKNGKWQGGATIRYLLSPRFQLPAIVKREFVIGQPPLPTDFTYRIQPEVNVGGLVSEKRWQAGVELHNLTSSNGSKVNFHFGAEYQPVRWLALRGGYDVEQITYGIGLSAGPFQFDVATGTDYRKLLSVGVGTRF